MAVAGTVNATSLPARPTQALYTTASSHSFSAPTSIDSLLDDFSGDIRSGDYAFTYNQAEAGVLYKGFIAGYSTRYDYQLRFSEELARIYHAASHDQVLPQGIPQQLRIEASHIRAHGPLLGWQWRVHDSFEFTIKAARLHADRMVDGEAVGTMTLVAEDEYAGDLQFNLHSSEDLLLEMPVPDPSGEGYSTDIILEWQANEQWQLHLTLRDAYSKIKWRNILYSDLTANTATLSYDDNGRLHTNPVLSGYQYLTNFTQTLPRKFLGRIYYQATAHHGLYVEQYHVPTYMSQTVLGYDWLSKDRNQLGMYWNTATRAIGVKLQQQWFSMSVGTDETNPNHAHALDLEFGLLIPLN